MQKRLSLSPTDGVAWRLTGSCGDKDGREFNGPVIAVTPMTVVFNLTGSQAHVGRASFLAGWPERSAAGRVARGAVIRLLPVTTKRDLCRSSGLICRRCIQFAGGSAGRRRPERGAVRSGRHYVFMRLVGHGQARFPVVKRGLARRNPARRIDGSNRGNDDVR